MSEDRDNELQAGVAELSSRLARVKLQIVKHRRPWHNRMAAYFAIGTLDHTTDVALSDEFIRDLPRTPEYQAAVDSYAAAVAPRQVRLPKRLLLSIQRRHPGRNQLAERLLCAGRGLLGVAARRRPKRGRRRSRRVPHPSRTLRRVGFHER
jgi:hypothetical protein